VIGVACSVDTSSQNAAFIIPGISFSLSHSHTHSAPMLQRVMDTSKPKATTFPWLGISTQPIENDGLRRSLHMSEKQHGVLVTRVFPTAPAAK
jgi:hypothetical protein